MCTTVVFIVVGVGLLYCCGGPLVHHCGIHCGRCRLVVLLWGASCVPLWYIFIVVGVGLLYCCGGPLVYHCGIHCGRYRLVVPCGGPLVYHCGIHCGRYRLVVPLVYHCGMCVSILLSALHYV